MKKLILIITLFLASCSERYQPEDIKLIEETCNNHGGIKYYIATLGGVDELMCKDNSKFYIETTVENGVYYHKIKEI